MKKETTEKRTKKKWITVAAASAALIGAGGVVPFGEPTSTTVQAAEESTLPEWTANSVSDVQQELASQNFEETLTYQIQWGDTLSALSVATGVSVGDIAAQNNIANPDLIYANEYLYGGTITAQATEEVEEAAEELEEPAEIPVEETEVEEAEEAEAAEESAEAETPEAEAGEETAELIPGDPVEPLETSEETPEAAIVLPADAEEEVVEEVLPEEPEEIESVEVVDIVPAEEPVEPNDRVTTEQPVAVVTNPSSHKEPSEAFIRPAQGRLSSGYGYRNNPFGGVRRLHAGIDIAGSGPVSAAQDGIVVAAQYHSGWGNYVKIDHGNSLQTLYAHMQNGSTSVSTGDTVSQGDTIGTMGSTGSATGVHLHFEVYVNGVQVDPMPYL